MMSKSRRITFGFTLGGFFVIAGMGIWVVIARLFRLSSFPDSIAIPTFLSVLLLLFGASGFIAGTSLQLSRRTTFGFAVSFLTAMVGPLMLLAAPTPKTHFALLLQSAMAFAFGFGAAGAFAATFLKIGVRTTLSSLAGFGLGGALGGLVASGALILSPFLFEIRKYRGTYENWRHFIAFMGLAIGLLIPYIVGGAVLEITLKRGGALEHEMT